MFNNRNTNKAQKLYTISLKTPKGNSVGFINLSSQFIQMLGKHPENITVADLEPINGDFIAYLKSLEITIEESTQAKPITNIANY